MGLLNSEQVPDLAPPTMGPHSGAKRGKKPHIDDVHPPRREPQGPLAPKMVPVGLLAPHQPNQADSPTLGLDVWANLYRVPEDGLGTK